MHLKEHTTLQRGRYSIIRTIGQGGFGITYLATQAGLNRKVVIKEFFMNDYCSREHDTLRVTMGTDGSRSMIVRFRDKFIKEARNIAELDHPNIVRVIDIFEENNTAYYVMEYHAGGSLASSINKGIPMSEKEALHYIRQVASALKYIHSCNMMHLDIKPDNILVNSRNEAVLIDFGLSKHYDNEGKASTTTPIGLSHGYAPIEQYDNGSGNVFAPTMDIYSLGATLCALLIGETPPRASTIISYGLPEFPDAVSNATRLAIDKAMSAKPTDRPQSVDEFLSLLDAPADDMPATEPMNKSAASRATQPMNKSAASRTTEPMNNGNNSDNNSGSHNSGDNKKPFNWKVPVAILAAILCVLFAGVGINEYNDYRAEQQRLAAAAKAGQDSINAVNRYNDSIAAADRRRNAFETKTFNVNGIYFTMVAVAGGTFNMGSDDGDDREKPVHSVTLSDYYIGETEVTQELWQAVMGSNPSYFKGNKNPVEQVSYEDCEKFIDKLNDLLAGHLPDGRKFRLPTEAQWEFAARGGNKGKNNNYKYSGNYNIDAVAWYGYDKGNSNKQTHPVKQKQPNKLGLYDMTGNVWEWCSDWYDRRYYSYSPLTNPEGPSSGSLRVFRGGSWCNNANYCRCTDRHFSTPSCTHDYLGFRLAL